MEDLNSILLGCLIGLVIGVLILSLFDEHISSAIRGFAESFNAKPEPDKVRHLKSGEFLIPGGHGYVVTVKGMGHLDGGITLAGDGLRALSVFFFVDSNGHPCCACATIHPEKQYTSTDSYSDCHSVVGKVLIWRMEAATVQELKAAVLTGLEKGLLQPDLFGSALPGCLETRWPVVEKNYQKYLAEAKSGETVEPEAGSKITT